MKQKVEVLEKLVTELTNKVVSSEAEKVEKLEVVVRAMSQKVLSLESELQEIKKNNKLIKNTKEQAVSKVVKGNYIEKEESREII